MSKPIAVLISDVHYNLQTLELADKAMRMAINKANELDVPLIVAGDLHDTKANLRGECVNALIETLQEADIMPWILVGNHDKINEKSEDNSLNFLSAYAHIVKSPIHLGPADKLKGYLVPYYHDPTKLKDYLETIPANSIVIMHQGIEGSNMGDYIMDRTAIRKEDVFGLRVISGHYHARQDIQLPGGGMWSYIGNPYTLGFGEAKDPAKGFQVLYEDGSLEFVPTNLRKHVVIDIEFDYLEGYEGIGLAFENDLLWIKITGTHEQLERLNRTKVAKIVLYDHFRLDLIPLDAKTNTDESSIGSSQPEVLDGLIDSLSSTSDERKERLKKLWKDLK